jgi:hypothetical protein
LVGVEESGQSWVIVGHGKCADSQHQAPDDNALRVMGGIVAKQVVEVADLAALRSLTSRGLGPSVPPDGQVHLTFLDEGDPQRSRAEAELSRYGQACGCEAGALAVLVVLAVLAAGQFVFDISVALLGIPIYLSWIIIALAVSISTKVLSVYHAKSQMGRLYRSIAAMAKGPSR